MNQELNDKIVNTLSLYCAENNEGRFNDFDLFGAANAIENLMVAQVSDVPVFTQKELLNKLDGWYNKEDEFAYYYATKNFINMLQK